MDVGDYVQSGAIETTGANNLSKESKEDIYKKRLAEWNSLMQDFKRFTENLKKSREQSEDYADEEIKSSKKKQIKMILNLASGMIARMYTKKSWRGFAEAMTKAVSIASRKDVSNNQLNEAIRILNTGMSKLEYVTEVSHQARGDINEMQKAAMKSISEAIMPESVGKSIGFSSEPVMLGSVPIAEPAVAVSAVDVNV